MTSLGDLTDQLSNLLHSYTGSHEQVTWLTAAVADTTATTLSVFDGEQVSQGIIEVGDELMYVASVNANDLTIAPFGRGYQGSTATIHDVNAKVTYDPIFPRCEIQRAINQTMSATYPALFAVKETTFTFAGSQATYELPADAEGVVKVQYQLDGASGYWPTLWHWEFEVNSEVATGKAITLHTPAEQNSTVKVTYRAPFTPLVASTDDLGAAGFPESATDVLVYGAASTLVRFLDISRLQIGSVENVSRAQYVDSGDPGKIANQLYAMYVQRLTEERKRLLEKEPPQMHFTR